MAEKKKDFYRILIVDDEASIREVLAGLLEAPNRSIEVRDTPRSALAFLQHNPVDLAFVDLMMPGMSGAELAGKIKKRSPKTHVVICSGYLSDALSDAVRATKADHFLQKPLDLGEVVQLADSYTTE